MAFDWSDRIDNVDVVRAADVNELAAGISDAEEKANSAKETAEDVAQRAEQGDFDGRDGTRTFFSDLPYFLVGMIGQMVMNVFPQEHDWLLHDFIISPTNRLWEVTAIVNDIYTYTCRAILGAPIVSMTSADYEALEVKDPNVHYIVYEEAPVSLNNAPLMMSSNTFAVGEREEEEGGEPIADI